MGDAVFSFVKKSLRYLLAPYVSLGFVEREGVLKFGFGSIQKSIREPELQGKVVDLAHFLLNPRSLEDIGKKSAQLSCSPHEAKELYSLFVENNFLIPENAYDRAHRYSRHALFYALSGASDNGIQSTLEQKSVSVIGCGGIGNLVSATLATAGVGRIVLVDNDTIELSNLTRQLMFCEGDEKKQKAPVLAEALKKRASNIVVESYVTQLHTADQFKKLPQTDLLVISGDSSGICHTANDCCFETGVPFINIGYIQDIAVWGPLIIPRETPCYRCFAKTNISDKPFPKPGYQKKIGQINQHYQAPSIGPVNMLAASLASLDVLKFLGGFGNIHAKERRVGLWTHDLHLEYQNYHRDPGCPVCAHPQTACL